MRQDRTVKICEFRGSRFPILLEWCRQERGFEPIEERSAMSDHVYKKIELTGSSTEGIEDAVRKAVAKAAETIHDLRWFEVVDTRGHIEDGGVAHWQVTVKIGFKLDE
jgi:flavin-binding protein dodecin